MCVLITSLYQICNLQIHPSSLTCLLFSSNGILCKAKVQNCVQFIRFFCFVLCLVDLAFCVVPKKSLFNLRSLRFSPVSCMVLNFTFFRSVVHFKLSFVVCEVQSKILFFPLRGHAALPAPHVRKTLFSPLHCLCAFVRIL